MEFRKLSTIILISSLGLLVPAHLYSLDLETGGRSGKPFSGFRMDGVEPVKTGEKSEDLQLRTLRVTDRFSPHLYLDFDTQNPASLQDSAGYYQVREASYIVSSDSWAGPGAALFNRMENRISLNSPEELWPGNGEPMGDFSIQMRIKPLFFYRNNDLFHKSSFLDGKKRGIEILIQDEVIRVHFQNLFRDNKNQERSLTLSGRKRIKTGEWQHFILSFEASTGRITLLVDGEEEATVYGADSAGVWTMAFHPLDRSPIFIGSSYAGLMDEVALSNESVPFGTSRPDLDSRYSPVGYRSSSGYFYTKTGSVISPVVRPSKGEHSGKGSISFQTMAPDGTAVDTWVRFSRNPFEKETPEDDLPWNYLKGDRLEIPSFAYLQWKASLHSDPNGEKSPTIRSVKIHFEENQAVSPPGTPEWVRDLSGTDFLTIQWNESTDQRVRRSGNYRIYYGVRPGVYDGYLEYRVQNGIAIKIAGDSPTEFTASEMELKRRDPGKFERSLDRKVRIRIDNETIEKNVSLHPRKRALPFIRPGFMYYFAVSAMLPGGDESVLSGECSGRSMAGDSASRP